MPLRSHRSRPGAAGAPVLEVQLFERAWWREYVAAGRSNESQAQTWPLGLSYDRAVVEIDIDERVVIDTSGPVGEAVTVTLVFQDSSDGIAWATLGTASFSSTGTGRAAVPAPFGSHLRVLMEVAGTGGLGLVHAEVRMTLRRHQRRRGAERFTGRPGVMPSSSPGDCGCGGGCGG